MGSFGFTISTTRLIDDPELGRTLEECGYRDAWSVEINGCDGVVPLATMASRAPSLRLGTAILPVYTRGPGLLAQTAATMAAAAPGRFVLGIGASSPAVVEQWNGIPHSEPFKRTRSVLRFLRAALAGERVTDESLGVRGFQLQFAPEQPPPVYAAALREGMLRLAGREADGVLVNWLAAEDVATVRGVFDDAAGGQRKEVAGRVFVMPTTDAARAREVGRRMIAIYLNVGVYAKFHEWLGRGPLLQDMWDAFAAGDRRAAAAAVPDEVVDALIVHGDPDTCRAHLQRYLDAGLDTAILMPIDPTADPVEVARLLGPGA